MLVSVKNIAYKIKSINSFQSGLRAAVRAFWNGTYSRSEFESEMRTVLNNRLNQAYDNVAKENDIFPNEYTIDEQLWIGRFIQEQLSYVDGLADDIEANSKANKGKLTPLLQRTEMWTNRWNEVQSRAKTFFDSDGKYEWVYGPTDHCSSCIRLNGIVKRGSFWDQAAFNGIYPQSKNLACKGFKCQCYLRKTDKRVTPGPLPRI